MFFNVNLTYTCLYWCAFNIYLAILCICLHFESGSCSD